MQVILDSSFARPGSAPIWGGKKGEFRDWTTFVIERDGIKYYNISPGSDVLMKFFSYMFLMSLSISLPLCNCNFLLESCR